LGSHQPTLHDKLVLAVKYAGELVLMSKSGGDERRLMNCGFEFTESSSSPLLLCQSAKMVYLLTSAQVMEVPATYPAVE
jgi:hypothetical protein